MLRAVLYSYIVSEPTQVKLYYTGKQTQAGCQILKLNSFFSSKTTNLLKNEFSQ